MLTFLPDHDPKPMAQNFDPGDFLLYQLEAGFGLIRILAIDRDDAGGDIWHLSVYRELFPDVDTAESALSNISELHLDKNHLALTERAFDRTPTAKLANRTLEETELKGYRDWQVSEERKVFDRSLLLLLGMR